MPRVTFFKTQQENLYMYSFNKNYILISNSIYIRLFVKDFKADLQQIPNLIEESRRLITYSEYSYSEYKYYINKYKMLKNVGFFEEKKINIEGLISAKDIEYELSNSRSVVFEITEKCNLKCKYCFYGDNYNQYDKRFNYNLKIEDAKAVLDFIRSKWKTKINISPEKLIFIGFYGGEPLLNFPFINAIVTYCKKIIKTEALNLKFNMTTNGVLLDKYMDFIVENDFIITISLDGDKQANSYRLHKNGKPSFDTVYKNVHLLKEKYPDYFSKNVKFNAVLHDKNNLIQIKEYIKKEFDSSIYGSTINPLLLGTKFKYESHKYDFNNKESLKCFLSSSETMGYNFFIRNYSNFHFENYNDVHYSNNEKFFLPTGTCNPFSRKIFITAQGKILPCEAIGHKFALGEVKNGKVQLETSAISVKYNNYYSQMRKYCASCHQMKFCTECLFLNIIKDDGSIKCKKTSNNEHSIFLSDYYSTFENVPNLYKEILENITYA